MLRDKINVYLYPNKYTKNDWNVLRNDPMQETLIEKIEEKLKTLINIYPEDYVKWIFE
jgi:hypothetical protein